MKSKRLKYFLFVLVICCGGCRDETLEETAARIAKSPRLQKIQRVCDELPKPSSFAAPDITISGNALISSLEYRYKANMTRQAFIDFYKNLPSTAGYTFDGVFSTGGLSPRTEIRFHRDGVNVAMENQSPMSIFVIGCSSQ